jgi:signal transduction histidine kinase
MLEQHGLQVALRDLADQFHENTLHVEIKAALDERIDPQIELAFYRLAQEAVTNIVKHANAAHVSIVVAVQPGSAILVITDDGVGFDPNSIEHKGLGLVAMLERFQVLGGSIEIRSRPGAGTTIRAHVPTSAGAAG